MPTPQALAWLEQLLQDNPALHYVTVEERDRIVQAAPDQADNIKVGPFSMAVPPRVLRYIASCVEPHHRTIETGCGQTTVALAALAVHHTAVTPDQVASRRILEYMQQLGIPQGKVAFRIESSEFVLPAMHPVPPDEIFDFAFVDGCHGYPLPAIDWHYIDYYLRVGGIIGFDNTEIRAVQHHCEFLEGNDSYAVRAKLDFRPQFEYGATFFTKLKDQHREWVFQAFNKKRPTVGATLGVDQAATPHQAPGGEAAAPDPRRSNRSFFDRVLRRRLRS